MVIKKLSDQEFKTIVEQLANRRKYIKYSFQELGYMLAEKLNDLRHKSLYFRLAKYENRELLMKAYMSVIDAPTTSKGRLFMWKLKQLRELAKYRAFIGLFIDDVSSVTRNLQNSSINKCIDHLKQSKLLVDPLWWHITLAFWGNLPGTAYMSIAILLDKFKTDVLKNDVIKTKLKMISYKNYANMHYIFIHKFEKEIYSAYHKLKTIFFDYKGKNKAVVHAPFLSHKFYPHITIARLKNKEHILKYKTCQKDLDISVKLKPFLTISRLTKNGPEYKIHPID